MLHGTQQQNLVGYHATVASESELELRRRISDGIAQLNDHHGGRYLSSIARSVGVDRATVARWAKGESSASVDNCRSLAAIYPRFFSEGPLVELHAQAALGSDPAQALLTVGATIFENGTDVHRAAAAALRADPGSPENATCKLTSLHLDRRGVDAIDLDPHMTPDMSEQVLEFRQAMSERASQGWKIQNVVVTANPVRMAMLEGMIHGLDGPEVEIKAYPMAVPLVLSPLIIGNREVFLAYDHQRFERPKAALHLRSTAIVSWASGYFDQLFNNAPFTLRSNHGPEQDQIDAFRAAVTQSPS